MVKRKDVLFDKKEKVKHAGETVRKVSRKLDFGALPDAFTSDGTLLVGKGDEVLFERVKESKTIVCVGSIVDTYKNGAVDVWDESMQQFFLFNPREHNCPRVKCWEVPPTKKAQEPHVELVMEQPIEESSDDDEPQEGSDDEPEVETNEQRHARGLVKLAELAAQAGPLPTSMLVIGDQPFKLFVDDERDPIDDSWTIARTGEEAKALVEQHGLPAKLALDHDLGMKPDGTVDQVPDFLRWLEERFPNDSPPPASIHTQNPRGYMDIRSILDSWKKSRE